MTTERTYLLTYQDHTGTIYESRLVSNHAEAHDCMKKVRLESIYKSFGFDLISVCQIDNIDELALHHEMPPPKPHGWMYKNSYRFLIAAACLLTAVDIALVQRLEAKMMPVLEHYRSNEMAGGPSPVVRHGFVLWSSD